MENKAVRKKWVKRFAVIFLVAMMLLTFFSNTIMNHSLAQVSTEQIVSDSVSSKVRGTGTVEADDETEIKIKESREVEDILVKAGDEVKEGDVLIKLKEGESNELEEAVKTIQELKDTYDNKILTEEIDVSLVTMAESGGVDKNSASAKLKTLSEQVKQAKERVTDLQKQSDAFDNGTAELAVAVKNAMKEYETANAAYETANTRFMALGIDENDIDELGDDNARALLNELNAAKETLQQKTKAQTDLENALNEKKADIAIELANANTAMTEATEAHEKYLTEINTVNDLKSQYETIKTKESELETMKAESVGNEIKAKVSGKIVAVNVEKGDTITPDTSVITMQEAGKGLKLSFTATKEQAAKAKKGDVASISDAWYYGDVTVTLRDIKADPQNPSKSRLLTFSIDGDVEIGQSMTVSVGEKSTKYDYVVPNNAVREDSNGKFILVVKEKSSPLGNRYVATRVNVEVIVSDDSKSAVSGAIEGNEYVITNANKLVNVGDYVRLAK